MFDGQKDSSLFTAKQELRQKSFSTLGSGNLLFLRQINPINPTKKTFFSFLGHSLALNGDKDKLFEKKNLIHADKTTRKRRRKLS